MSEVKTPPRTASDAATDGGRPYVFYREGEYWTLAYGGTLIRLRHSKGLNCLAHLLRHPGQQFDALYLLRFPDAPKRSGPEALNASSPRVLEEARVVVTKRIRSAVQKIQAHHPALGYHLSTTIKTGAFCTYVPDPQRPIAWTV